MNNGVVDYMKQSSNTADMLKGGLTRTLVLYCGGTIGMKNDPEVGYISAPGYLTQFLSTDRRFHDPIYFEYLKSLPPCGFDIHAMKSELGEILVMPTSMYGKRCAFQIYEYNPLKDSSIMNMDDWITLATDIEKYYDYDAFIILHGTDTMAYSASALSFLLENLGKTVIFTGSQIPFSELRNDAYDNFLGALTLAAHYIIPEVTLFFHNRLIRGNRSSKVDAVDFNAFSSPNLKPLAKLGVKIKVEWHEILRPTCVAPFTVCKQLNHFVGALRLFPGIHGSAIRAFAAEPMRGIVLETFGAGNAPQSPDFLEALREAISRGVVIVNVTQCIKGGAMNMYSTGHSLAQVGVIFGGDMTPECALTKLSYLLGHPEYDPSTIARLMTESLRGEITIKNQYPDEDNTSQNPTQQHSLLGEILSSTLESCHQSLRKSTNDVLRPLLMHQAAANGDITALAELDSRRTYIDSADYQGKTCLHIAIMNGKLNAVKWLVEHGANVHARDSFGNNSVSLSHSSCSFISPFVLLVLMFLLLFHVCVVVMCI
jgi:60kDa lysophospholipase